MGDFVMATQTPWSFYPSALALLSHQAGMGQQKLG
jgi:hypothetical protein